MGKAKRAHAVPDLMGALRFTHPTDFTRPSPVGWAKRSVPMPFQA
ncbi:hypothetical protein [Thioalkalivibrio sulfidiphilus]|nr:hypothetical protein [Thioalkalivibrio sulfidiphilus]